MINVLERKGILTGKEVLNELEVIVASKILTFPSPHPSNPIERLRRKSSARLLFPNIGPGKWLVKKCEKAVNGPQYGDQLNPSQKFSSQHLIIYAYIGIPD